MCQAVVRVTVLGVADLTGSFKYRLRLDTMSCVGGTWERDLSDSAYHSSRQKGLAYQAAKDGAMRLDEIGNPGWRASTIEWIGVVSRQMSVRYCAISGQYSSAVAL